MDADPVFEEEYHGAIGGTEDERLVLGKEESTGSTSGRSVEDEDYAKRV